MLPENTGVIPKPNENFSATVEDNSGVATKLTHFSIDGGTFLPARRGQGTVSIPFGRIVEIAVRDGKASVCVTEGPPAEVSIDDRLEVAGQSDFGPYRITLKNVRRIVIHGKR
jgi:hypothetical protein